MTLRSVVFCGLLVMTELESTDAGTRARSVSYHSPAAPRINRSWNVANSTNLCRGSSILLTEAKTRKTCGSANVKFLHWNDSETTVGVKMTNSKNRKLAAKNKVGRTALVRPIPIDPKNGVYALNRALGGFLGINANGSLISQIGIELSSATSFLLVEVWCQENKIPNGLANHCKIVLCARRPEDTAAFLIGSPTCSFGSVRIADGQVCKDRDSFLSAVNSTRSLKDSVFKSCYQFVRMNPTKHREWLSDDVQCS